MKPTSAPDSFISRNKPVLVFFFRFLLFFVLLMTVHFFTRFYTSFILITKLNAGVSSTIINLVTPSEHTAVDGQVIRSGQFMLTIARGCDGVDGILLVTAALLAFPLGWRRRTTGIAIGILLLYAANLARIVSLYYITKYKPELFDLMHVYVWQTLTIFIGIVFFAWWTGKEKAEG